MDRRLKRGEVWTASGGSAYAGKPRPVVIVQDNQFDATDSIVMCPITSDKTSAPLFRVALDPDDGNGLRRASFVMTDKIGAIPTARIGRRIGRLSDADVARLNRSMFIFLGLG